jgi:hypothetical protein
MRLRAQMAFPDLAGIFRDQVARGFTQAMKRETRGLEKEFEAATMAAGLGQGMARTWQSRTYPVGKDALGAAGQIWSKAPKAMRAFTEGATITAKGGRFLAIPSPETLRLRGGRNQRAPTPADIERRLGVKLVLVEKRGKRFLVAPSRDRGRRRGRLFVAFFLVPRAVIRKRLHLPPMVQAAQTRLRMSLAETITAVERSLGGRR